MKRKVYLTALAVLSVTATGSAYAAKSAENDALAVAGAKISMTQAVTAAKQHVGGKGVPCRVRALQGGVGVRCETSQGQEGHGCEGRPYER